MGSFPFGPTFTGAWMEEVAYALALLTVAAPAASMTARITNQMDGRRVRRASPALPGGGAPPPR